MPGSRWSGIAQEIKKRPGYNTSDRAPHRKYEHSKYSGHIDAYFGTGMEFDTSLDESNLLAPFSEKSGCKLLMSHEWAYVLDDIVEKYPTDWIQLIFRPELKVFFGGNKQEGLISSILTTIGTKDDVLMARIEEQNDLILSFAQRHSLKLETTPYSQRYIFTS